MEKGILVKTGHGQEGIANKILEINAKAYIMSDTTISLVKSDFNDNDIFVEFKIKFNDNKILYLDKIFEHNLFSTNKDMLDWIIGNMIKDIMEEIKKRRN